MLLHETVEYWADRAPETPCLVEGDRILTYGAVQRLAEQVAAALTASGLAPDTRIAVLGNNASEVPIVMMAASRAGLVPVPINPRLAPRECSYILNDAGVRVLFSAPELLATIEPVRAEIPGVLEFVCWDEKPHDGWRLMSDWIAGRPSAGPVPRGLGDAAYQIYTSGTTGKPKGVVHSHASVAALMMRWHLCGMYVMPGEKFYLAMPTTLAAGLSQTLATLYSGGTLELAKFDPQETLRGLANRAAGTALAPTMIQMLLRANDGTHDFSSLKWILYGAAPMPVPVLQEAMQVLGCDFYQGYGQSEAPAVTMMTPEQHRHAVARAPEKLGSLGRPQIGCAIKIVDVDDNEVAAGTVGEICARAPVVMLGYWNRPEESAKTARNGWHHTGDFGYLTPDGDLYLVDRLANLILSGGYNVYPREVEQVLENVEGVDQVVVVGVPDELWGQRVTAVVVPRNGSKVTAQDLEARCRGEIASYKIPKSWWTVDELPVNANGKVQRDVLRDTLEKTGTQL
jgi:acyl-CoA synthetase (AMP-forming)/AMP-acid ligase II